jgi:hypothetical protein
MRAADIRARLREKPFTPFRIRLTDGTVHEICDPNGAMVTERNVLVGIKAPDDRPRDFRDYALVTILHIVQMDPVTSLPATAPASSTENGEPT